MTSVIVVVDFGSQTAHLIARRLADLGAQVRIAEPSDVLEQVMRERPLGIVLSGGPASVYGPGAPTIDPRLFELGIPLLCICYGFQLAAQLLGGTVRAGRPEYGPATLAIHDASHPLVRGVPLSSTVWMSHGDHVEELSPGLVAIASTPDVAHAIAIDDSRKTYGLQFHPEVEQTVQGAQLLQNFLDICGVTTTASSLDIAAMEQSIRDTVGSDHVIGAVSGGVDSTVAACVMARAIGDHFIPVHVDNGLMRPDAQTFVREIFDHIGVPVHIVEARDELLIRLHGVTDSEEKRRVIGKHFIDVFEREMVSLNSAGKNIRWLMQGTLFSDVIESKGSHHADKIKSHHNVGGLPDQMALRLIEPLRALYKDQVQALGATLGIPHTFLYKQKFPGPGFAIRIRGEVTPLRLEQERLADAIVLDEVGRAGLLADVFHSFPVMTGALSTAVKGDGHFTGEVVAIRVTTSSDEMTADWARLPYDVLQKMSSRIVNEVQGISRVVYDITTKPPATMEWE